MKTAVSGRFRRVARNVADAFRSRAIVLLYHRVNELPSDPQLLCVSRKHFAEHLRVLQDYTRPATLKTLRSTLAQKMLRHPVAIITFDDGYADNLHHAKPLLEQFDMPGTVFVTTGFIGTKSGFWKDVLNRVLLRPGILPRTLVLNINGSAFQWELGEGANYGVEEFQRYRRWDVSDTNNPTMRQHLYRSLSQLLQRVSDEEQKTVLDKFVGWAGPSQYSSLDDRILSAEEVIRLAKDGLVEVGSHTASHPVLSSLTVSRQREEIQQSKNRLEEILGSPVTSFAYPYGGRSHYTAETVAITRESGFDVACSNFEGIVRQNTNMYEVPRFLVRDWNGEEFARNLRNWLSY